MVSKMVSFAVISFVDWNVDCLFIKQMVLTQLFQLIIVEVLNALYQAGQQLLLYLYLR